MQLAAALIVVFGLVVLSAHGVRRMNREKRLLNLFQIVRFPNDPCNSSSAGSKNGTCYTAEECSTRGGSSSTSCASGFGVCCIISVNCGATSTENCTYFDNAGSQTGGCSATICKCSTNICQFRLDFVSFSISGPSTSTAAIGLINRGIASNAGKTVSSASRCLIDTFQVTGASTNQLPIICGQNTGKHMYVDVSNGMPCIRLDFQLGVSTGSWSIKVNQYSCDYENLAPSGCTEYYFTGQTGEVTTYNFNGGQHLANQRQSICIRRHSTNCRICYSTAADTDFVLSGTTITPKGRVAGCCGYGGSGSRTDGYDCLFIPRAENAGAGASLKSEFCGRSKGLVTSGATTTSTTICSTLLPFHLLFLSDNFEFTGAIREANVLDRGFRLQYFQDANNCP